MIVKEFPATVGADGHLLLSFRGPDPLPSLDPHSPYELSEDYVTALAEDGAGHLLVGHRQKGVEMLDVATGKHVAGRGSASPETDFVTALLPRADGTLWIAGYGAGLSRRPIVGTTSDGVFAQTPSLPAALPQPEPPPTLAELNAMLKTVSAVAPDKNELAPKVVPLADDWQTEGDWLGRYGRYWTCLCATSSPTDYVWGAGWEPVRYALQMGPGHGEGDKLRYWIQWLYTQNPRVLELPSVYLDTRVQRKFTTWDNNRRESEVDDHGETYPETLDGPHICCSLTVPTGLFYLSLYDFNKDGHNEGGNRFRDYRISIRPDAPQNDFADINNFPSQPELAHGRIRDFCGGVYKRFLVRGPMQLTIEVNRNYSLNTILPAIMLDLVDENPPPYFGTPEQRLVSRNQNRQLLLTQWHDKTIAQCFAPFIQSRRRPANL